MVVFTMIVVVLLVLTTVYHCSYSVNITSFKDGLYPALPLNTTTLYHDKCCNSSNTGNSFITDTSTTLSIVFCPSTIPESCPNTSSVIVTPPPLKYSSCIDALSDNSMLDGYYTIDGTDDGIDNGVELYCTVTSICGTSNEVWTRVAFLNMSDPSQPSCPDKFGLYEFNDSRRVCGRVNTTVGSCVSEGFYTGGVNYTHICGRVRGYQYGSPDAIDTFHDLAMEYTNIDSHYADCVSITRGIVREHVWTYMAGLLEKVDPVTVNMGYWPFCPCIENVTEVIESFIGNNYYCESGVNHFPWSLVPYFNDPLWDGKQCNNDEVTCCNGSSIMPWFHKILATPTSDPIELRICCDQGTDNEDVLVEEYEIYVK